MNGSPPDAKAQRAGAAIEAVYQAFAAPAPSAIEGCPCCTAERAVDVLLTTPLRQLSGQALWSYVSGAFLTLGDSRDFKYLLPRILEVAVSTPYDSIDPEIVLGKLRLAEWETWPGDQRRAVEELIDAWFELALARDLKEAAEGWVDREAESVLCGIARAGLPLSPWLARLRQPDAAPALADLRGRYPRQLSAFWEDARAGFSELSGVLAAD